MSGTRPYRKASDIGAGLTGGGCGVIIAHLASHLPETLAWKQYAVDLVPAFSIMISGTVVLARHTFQEFWKKRRADNFYRHAKRTLEDGLHNGLASPAHKLELKKKLEQLEKMYAEQALARYMTEPSTPGLGTS